MSTLELKLSLIEQLKQIDDEQLLHKIKNLISQHTGKKVERLPAQMTVDELKEVLKKSIEESKQGLGMTSDELRKRHPLYQQD
ncbi:hypothetical protein DWX23_18445 [Parabacteroides sp. AF18-52]|uniref:hypothetical protein n=1 Tax=Parabacteroides TaxID=375288 RepID=UPI000EFFFFCD|nr:hypothetical protein [Parabacteroides sp. AF18-52]RHR37580.1 hypothetical protein DWX23_18445 [Parabacteroides sp. AF18-52]